MHLFAGEILLKHGLLILTYTYFPWKHRMFCFVFFLNHMLGCKVEKAQGGSDPTTCAVGPVRVPELLRAARPLDLKESLHQ